MFASAAWLAVAWAMLRLEPMGIGLVAGPVVLFGAVCEMMRALAGTRTWWLNAGLGILFAVTGLLLLASPDSSLTTPASLVGWYLLVRGSADVAVGVVTRDALLLTLGVLQTGLGFFSSSAFGRTPEMLVMVLGAMGVLRAVADLVAALRLRENTPEPEERTEGLAGYAAGLADFEATGRHRAKPGSPSGVPVMEPAVRGAEVPFHSQVLLSSDQDATLTPAPWV
ncbi:MULTISPECIES: DUF308 domain-containing protein [Actinoplanes]|uniref:DUF308 domain-containing protein n=1 Tax=Actinoplanes TaxID=1865 RepID=UPI000697E5CA|nr:MULTISPECIES: DUF308 domain-containing protein [Actinoplanes]GLY01949.1 hypothetical protein Acsp01_23280 [Actinoplanes sp. NBRC 101535]